MRAKNVQNFIQDGDPYKIIGVGRHATDLTRMNYIEKAIQRMFHDSTLKFEKIPNRGAIVSGSYDLYFNDEKESTLFYNPNGSTFDDPEYEDGWNLEDPHVGHIFRHDIDDFDGLLASIKHHFNK